jgi:hypothetical protein
MGGGPLGAASVLLELEFDDESAGGAGVEAVVGAPVVLEVDPDPVDPLDGCALGGCAV